jgi:hypothetical protein
VEFYDKEPVTLLPRSKLVSRDAFEIVVRIIQ